MLVGQILVPGVSGAATALPATTWVSRSPATSPPARSLASMAYDPATGQLVLFGGIHETPSESFVVFGDTWTHITAPSGLGSHPRSARGAATRPPWPTTRPPARWSSLAARGSTPTSPSETLGPITALPGPAAPRHVPPGTVRRLHGL